MVKFFIERPVFASSIAIIMVLAGLICWAILPVAQFPEITPPQVIVTSTYPGASAQVVADTVTTPLEQQINGVQGMAYMSSVSANDGTSIITITFEVGYPVSIGAVDVQNRVSQAAASLPSIVNQSGITIQKKNPNFALAINLYSPDNSVDPVTISNFAYLQVVDPLEARAGRERRDIVRRAALFDARVARSRQARQARDHRRRRAAGDRRAECAGRRRQARRLAGAAPAPPSRCRSMRSAG